MSGVPSTGTYLLGRYRVVDEIGIGGMASVHLARVDGLGGFQRWFAIKRIHPHLVEDESFVNMFLDEANVAARISHPNVATVFELGKHDDTYWIAMEYLHGEPLREVMRRTEEMGSTMPPEIACRVIAEAADGLHAAHELQGKDGEKLNLIHRDVTPHNLFVTYDGVTKVVDFGIAKFQDRMASTQAGTLKGKLAYMSPEQVQGEPIDRRTDIFALGVVLWELTTGQRLFRMDSDLDTLAKVQECNIPRPSTMVRGYPIDLEKILMQALAKNRNERFPTAREFSRALQSLLTRRGLFIASDEVAAYMASIFQDRIQKREEHLRWASAVSDAAVAKAPPAPPPQAAPRPPTPASRPPAVPARVHTSSAVHPSAPISRVPRPAAGAPSSSGGPKTLQIGPQHNLARPATTPLMPVQAQPPRRPSLPPPPPPRPAAGYPPPAPSSAPRAQGARPVDDDDEDRTVQATAEQQAAAAAQAYDDYDDNDATIVSRSPSESQPPSAPVVRPVVPAAGRPVPLPSFNAGTPAPDYEQRTLAVPVAAPMPPGRQALLKTQMGLQPSPPSFPETGFVDRGIPPTFNITDPSLPSTMASPAPPLPQVPPPWGAQQYQPSPYGPPVFNGQAGPPPTPYGGPPNNGTMQSAPYGLPPIADPRFIPAPIPRPRPIPAWAVAVASGLVALVLAGGTVLVVALVRSHRTDVQVVSKPGTQGAAVASASTAVPSASAAPASSVGIFSAARSGFLAAASPPPLTGQQPPETPPDVATAVAAATAPPDPAPAAPPTAAAVQADPPLPPVTPTVAQPVAPAPQVARNWQPPVAPVQRSEPASAPASPSGAMGLLSVICVPGCDQVYDGNKLLGPSPIFKRQVAVGSHRIKLVSSNPPGTKVVSKIVTAEGTATIREAMP